LTVESPPQQYPALERVQEPECSGRPRVTHARVQSVLSLALLYWSRVSTKTDSCIIGGHKTIYIANDSLLRRLRDAYADYDDFTLADDAERYFRGMLWAL
jgi:hypothetical protein